MRVPDQGIEPVCRRDNLGFDHVFVIGNGSGSTSPFIVHSGLLRFLLAIAGLVGIWLSATTEAHAQSAPTVVSVTRKTPLAQALLTDTVVYEVTFSEDISNLGVSSFVVTPVNGSSVSAVVASVSGGPRVYAVTVNLNGGTGNFRLDVVAAPMAVTQFASGFVGSYAMTSDSVGNLYVAYLSAGTIRKITPDGTVSTYASGFSSPRGLAFDSVGNLYVSNTGTTVSKVTPGGVVTTFASGFSSPIGLAVDSADNLYVANSGSANIKRVTPQGVVEGTPFATGLGSPWGMAFDGSGNLFVADANGTVRKVTPAGTVSTFATGFITPLNLAFDSAGMLYVANANGSTIKQVTPSGVVSTVASVSSYPSAVAFGDAGGLYALEYYSGKVFKLTPGPVTDLAGNKLTGLPYTAGQIYTRVAPAITSITRKTPLTQVVTTNTAVFDVTYSLPVTGVVADIFVVTAINGSTTTGIVTALSGGPTVYQVTVQLTSGAGDFRLDVAVPSSVATTFATGFSNPSALAFDSAGDLYVSNYDTNTISKVTSGGAISIFASGFNGPTDLAFDVQGTLYVTNNGDGSLSQVTSNGNVSTFVTGLAYPMGLAIDSTGNLYVSTAEDNAVWSVAGDGTASLFASGFNNPNALAFDSGGNLYVANQGDNSVSKLTSDGSSSYSFSNSVSGADGLAFDSSGNLYVANNYNNNVSKITSGGSLSTFATGINQPTGLAFDSTGRLYVASQADGTVTRLTTLAPIADLFGNQVSALTYTQGESYTYALNVAPTDIILSHNTVGQSDGANANVGTLTTTDADSGDSHTYTLVTGAGDTDNALFNTSSSTLRADNATELAPGSYSVRVLSTDSIGANFAKAFTITVVDDVVPSAPSTPDLATESDTGSSSADNITSIATPTFTGTAEANSTVQLFRGGSTLLGTTTTDGSGNWTLTVGSALGAGTYSITAKAKDTANNLSGASAALSITIAGAAPSATSTPDLATASDTGSSDTDNITSVTTPTFTGTTEASSTVQLFRGSSTLLGTTTADSSGNWSFTVGTAMNEGVYSITAKATDIAGQTGAASAALILTIDTTASAAPVITAISNDTGVSNSDHITSDTTLVLSGTAAANETVILFRNAAQIGTCTANGSGVWSFDYTGTTLASGTHTFTVKSSDVAGNLSDESAEFLVEIDVSTPSAPVITVITTDTGVSATDGITSDATLIFSGTADAGSTVTISRSLVGVIGSVVANGSGTWSFDYSGTTLPDGDYLFTAFARNTVGNTSAVSADFPVTIDTTAPTITAQPVGGTHAPADSFTLSVTAFDPGALSYQWYFGASALSDNSDWSGSTTASLTHSAGENSLPGNYTVRITDLAGNSITSQIATVAIGGADQTITFSPIGPVTVGAPVTLSATASSGLAVTFSVISGNATISGSSFTANDANSITLRATQAGNADYHAATADQIVSNIAKLSQTITFAAMADKLADAAAFSLSASATSSLPVTFAVVSGPATVSGSTLTLTGLPGTVTVVAHQSGDAIFSAAPDVNRSFIVTANYPAPASDGFADSATGGAGAGSQQVIVANAAEFLAQVNMSAPSVITVVGTVNLGAGIVQVQSNKTIQGLDGNTTLVGTLNIASDVTNVVIRGLNLTNPGTTLVSGIREEAIHAIGLTVSSKSQASSATDGGAAVTISGARNVFITHCSFFDCADYAVKITNGSDNIAISWSEFGYTSGQGPHRASVLIGSAGAETAPLHVSLHHNWWSAGVDQGMPAATYGYVHLYNNYFNTPGNTDGTEALDQSQVLSERNVYAGVNNPLTRRQVDLALPIGRILALGNLYSGTTGTLPYAGADAVFTPSYSYEMLPVSDVAAVVSAHAGNNAGANSVEIAAGSATLTGPGTPVARGANFALKVTASGVTPSSYQWRRNNLDIPGAIASSYSVTNAQETHAGTYTVALGLTSEDRVVSSPLVVTLAADPVVVPPTTPPPGDGGGGTTSAWYVGGLVLLVLLRFGRNDSRISRERRE